jgi:hypothetical protein
MKKPLQLLALISLLVGVYVGCTTGAQRVAYNTLYTIEHTTAAAYDGYTDAVIQGLTPTNSLPKVSKMYDKFNASFLVALDAVQYNTNAIAPASLVVESQDIINLITSLKH